MSMMPQEPMDKSATRALLDDRARLQDRLAQYLTSVTGADIAVEHLVRFPVGFSWITYGVKLRRESEPKDMILRLGPSYGLLAPYSAAPEFHSLQALQASGVPVPKAYYWSDDPNILGAPFFLCEKVAGEAPIPWVSGEESKLEEKRRKSLARDFIDALATLHRFDWRATPLRDWDCGIATEIAAARQIAHWRAAHQRWKMRPHPMVHHAFAWLSENAVPAKRVSIVHGDYRIGNFLEVDGRISAILDWELVHLGDPHEDLAWAMLPQYRGGSGLVSRLASEDDFLLRYQEQADFEVDRAALRFYTVLSLLKLALTHMAAARSFEEGDFNDMRMPAMATQIGPALRQIQKTLESAR
jgi:aminoglycoside phosphotransferase (APT) family kinase protein